MVLFIKTLQHKELFFTVVYINENIFSIRIWNNEPYYKIVYSMYIAAITITWENNGFNVIILVIPQ